MRAFRGQIIQHLMKLKIPLPLSYEYSTPSIGTLFSCFFEEATPQPILESLSVLCPGAMHLCKTNNVFASR